MQVFDLSGTKSKINQMFYFNRMCQYYTLIVTDQVSSLSLCGMQLTFWVLQCGVCPVTFSWTEGIPVGQSLLGLCLCPISLHSNFLTRIYLIKKNVMPWEQPAWMWLYNMKILSFRPVKARTLHPRTSLMRLYWATPTVCSYVAFTQLIQFTAVMRRLII